jgi:hypothetical protein
MKYDIGYSHDLKEFTSYMEEHHSEPYHCSFATNFSTPEHI